MLLLNVAPKQALFGREGFDKRWIHAKMARLASFWDLLEVSTEFAGILAHI